jgi:hypothetical protein
VPISATEVSTDRASRYLVQLCEHLNQIGQHARHGSATGSSGPPAVRRAEWTDSHGVIEFPTGECTLDANDHTLTITLAADDPDELRRMQELFATRLETIGRRDRLTVAW